jgi:signal transduction histidine kinase/CHASE3 domain sensor protein
MALALVVGIAFASLVLAIRAQGDATSAAVQSERVSTQAHLLERLLLDLETGQRAYVITAERSFLESWDAALRAYPEAAADLRSLVVDPMQRRRVALIEAGIDKYVREWSQPIVDLTAIDREAAARRVATGEGKQRIDQLRRRFDEFVARQRELSDERNRRADVTERRATVIGIGGLAISVLLVVLFAAYLFRSTVVPVEAVAAAARRLRAGDRSARVPERAGTDEAATLTRDFNAMADALQDGFDAVGRRGAELEAVLDAAVEGITMTDLEGRLVFSNAVMDAFWRELGVAEKGSVWSRIAGLVELTGEAATYEPAFARVAADPEAVFEDEFEIPALLRSFRGYTAPVRGADGRAVGRIFSVRETTRERSAEGAKEQFLATVSHELRTPLTSILGFTDLVRHGGSGSITAEQRRFLDVVARNARHLNSLVDDLLLVGRAGEGRLELETEDVDVADLARRSLEAAETAAAEKAVVLELDAPEPVVLDADERRLTQLFDNLIGNAIKFTPQHGRVKVRVATAGGNARVEVADSGAGIASADQERLFERFYRASSATGTRVPGTGLGLAIAKAIVDAHGGSIAVRSAEGEGATFCIDLPGVDVSDPG